MTQCNIYIFISYNSECKGKIMWPRNVLGVTEAHGLTGNLMRRAKWGIVDI